MGLLRISLLVLVVGFLVRYFLRGDSPLPPSFGGFVETGFEDVERVFRENFEKGYEPDGAAYAVCHRGKLVVDLWGGYADKMAMRPWKQDTIALAFSTTKAVAALTIAMLVDRGNLNYDDLITKYWPEFGAFGKENVTVKMLLSHRAGLAALDGQITMEAIRDWRQMSRLFENQAPLWPPGTTAGYHMLTFGFLCDQLVRRVDPQQRSLGTFFHEEVAKPFGIDFFIGLPRDQYYRAARLTPSGLWDIVKRLDDWQFTSFLLNFMFAPPSPIFEKAQKNPAWLFAVSQGYIRFNDPEVLELEMPAGNGIGTARSLAQLFCLLDGPNLLSRKTVERISVPDAPNAALDLTTGLNLTWTFGFIHTESPLGSYQLGHPGYGGQNVKFDPQEGLGLAYLRNSMVPDMGELTRTLRSLQRATYDSITRLKSKGV